MSPALLDFTMYHAALTPQCVTGVLVLCVSIFVGECLNSLLKRRALAATTPLSQHLLRLTKGLPRLWCIAFGLNFLVTWLDLSDRADLALTRLISFIFVYSTARVAERILNHLVENYTQGAVNSAATSTLLSNLVSVVIYGLALIVFLGFLGISVAPFLTALGIGGMAIALGLQETMANLFAGLHLILSRQIRIGNHIRLSSGEEGIVTDITWRYTTVCTAAKNDIIVPNKTIAAATLTNYDLPNETFTLAVPLGVSYDSDLEAVEALTVDVAKEVLAWTEESGIPAPVVRYGAFGDSAITFTVFLYLPGYAEQGLVRHRFIKALTAAYRVHDINIPYPIYTIQSMPDVPCAPAIEKR